MRWRVPGGDGANSVQSIRSSFHMIPTHTLSSVTARFFIPSVCVLLFVTGALKLFAALSAPASAGSAPGPLDSMDAVVWFVSQRQLLGITSQIEFAAGLGLLLRRSSAPLSLLAIGSIGAIFLSYRVAKALIGVTGAGCGCLGLLASPWYEFTAKCILAWMLCGSGLLLFMHRHIRSECN